MAFQGFVPARRIGGDVPLERDGWPGARVRSAVARSLTEDWARPGDRVGPAGRSASGAAVCRAGSAAGAVRAFAMPLIGPAFPDNF